MKGLKILLVDDEPLIRLSMVTQLARSVFKKDEILDDINIKANAAVADFILSTPDRINQSLYILSTIRKLERVGDQCKNIAEEIIFYVEAKVLKHKSLAQKENPGGNT